MATKWKVVDHQDAVLRKLHAGVDDAMDDLKDFIIEAIQEKILYGYRDAHGDPPHTEIVDTGALFDDVTATVTKSSQNTWALSAGNTAAIPYAQYVHDGTSKLKGRPYARDAFLDNAAEIKKRMNKNIGKKMK